MAHMDPSLMTKDMKARFTKLFPANDTLMSPVFMALVAAPLLAILVSLRAHIFCKDALLHYPYGGFRFSVEYGWICACCTITAYILSRPFKHRKLTKVVLFIFGLISYYTLRFDVEGYYDLFVHHYYGIKFN